MLELPWYIFALLAALVVAISSLLEKDVLRHEEPLHFSSATSLVGGILSLPFLLFIDWSALGFVELSFLYLISFLSMLAFWLVAKAMKNLDVGEVSTILALVPAAVAVIAYLVLGESLTSTQTGGITVIVLGLLVLEAPHVWSLITKTPTKGRLVYVGLALLAVLLYATGSVIDRVALTTFGISAIQYVALIQVMIMINFMAFERMRGADRRESLTALRHAPRRIIAVALLLFLSRILYLHAISIAFVALASALKRTSAIFSILLSGAILHEEHLVRKLVAASLIILGVVAIVS